VITTVLNSAALRFTSIPGWRRLSAQYRSYMQIILLGAAIVSLAIQEWSIGVLLPKNAVGGRQPPLRVKPMAC
jgi:hypothetical protein